MNKKHLNRVAALLGATLLISACQTIPQATPLPKELRVTSVVSTSNRNFAPQPGATVRWRGKLAVHAPAGTPSDPEQLSYIHDQVEAQLLAKGYQLVADGQPATYVLQGLIVLGNELNEKALRDILGFEPGLVAAGTEHQKGSLLLMLLDPANNETQWRSAVQLLVTPELAEDVRQERIRFGVASLLRPLPTLVATP